MEVLRAGPQAIICALLMISMDQAPYIQDKWIMHGVDRHLSMILVAADVEVGV